MNVSFAGIGARFKNYRPNLSYKINRDWFKKYGGVILAIFAAALVAIVITRMTSGDPPQNAQAPVGIEMAKLTQEGINLLRGKNAMTEADLNETRVLVNAQSAKIKQLSERLEQYAKSSVIDPQMQKVIESLRADVEALKQATKTVPLLRDQVSQLDTNVKTLGQRFAAEFRGSALASTAEVRPSEQVRRPQVAAPRLATPPSTTTMYQDNSPAARCKRYGGIQRLGICVPVS